jgi:NADPH:quinone reductase-like Zn-dependent oxidoreductase
MLGKHRHPPTAAITPDRKGFIVASNVVTEPSYTADPLSPSKACRVHRFGGPEVISFETIGPLHPGEDEVLVRVKAAGVGPWDGWIRSGHSALPQPLPLTLGSDLAGVVVAVGANVTSFAPGDAIFGVTNARFTGSYANYALASAAMIARKPESVPDIDVASVPVIAVTAWQALFEQAALVAGQRVLIHGAAGNVGAFAVQFAHRAGLYVIATCGDKDVAYVRSLGADEVLPREGKPFEATVHDVDAVIDLVGGAVQQRSFAVVKRGGALISAVSPPDPDAAAAHAIKAAFFLVSVTTERLETIARMMAAETLAIAVGAVLPLASARIAHEMLEGLRPRPRGKIVLQVATE